MKHFFLIFLFLNVFTSVSGQSSSNTKYHLALDASLIDHIQISKHLKPKRGVDTAIFIAKEFTQEQVNEFVNFWNTAVYDKRCDSKNKYYVNVFLKDGSTREFRAGKRLKEEKDHCFIITDPDFCDRVWNEIKESTTNKNRDFGAPN